MPIVPLTDEMLRHASDALAQVAGAERDVASKLIGEVLLAQAAQRSATVSHALIDARMESHGANDATAQAGAIKPIEVLRHGPRTEAERALVSVLMALHLAGTLESDGGAAAFRALAPGLDWLEFTGPYAPYSAARLVLTGARAARFESLLQNAPVEAASEAAARATLALRGSGVVDASVATVRDLPSPSARPDATRSAIDVAGEVDGIHRGMVARVLGIVTGWSLVRGVVLLAARHVFSLRRPMTLTLDGELLRVVGHTEMMGRTLATFDVRYPLDELVEVRRESRYPLLPLAISLVAVSTGALFGARSVIEGAGVAYFPLVAIGIGLILGGITVDLLLRALFPGVRGACRVVLRARDARAIVLTQVAIEEVERVLEAIDRHFGNSPRPRSTDREVPTQARPVGPAPIRGPSAPRSTARS